MPNFTVSQIRDIMDETKYIRSMSVIAHVDHGKSTLTDSLICKAGIISAKAAGDARFTDTRADEQERGVTIKSTGVSLYFEHEEDGKSQAHLINLIDSPGHVDFSSEVTAALRITDGALVVIDCVEGCAVQTETVLRQALQERVRPTLFMNKVDRCILEMQMEPEDMYTRFRKSLEDVNVIVATYNDDMMGDCQVAPEKGTVAFGSGLHGWGFNIQIFAAKYASKFSMDKDKMMKRLWGDWFFDKGDKAKGEKPVWTTEVQPARCSKPLERAFCQFILTPIAQLMRAIMDDNKEKYKKMMDTVGVVLKGDDRDLSGKPLMKKTMQIWINAADTLLSMIVTKLPSPVEAQKYRCATLYEGPMDDTAANAIKACDPKGGLMMYVSKMVPAENKGRFHAFGRVFSGTIQTGQKVRIQGPNYVPGAKEDLNQKSVQRTLLMMGSKTEQIQDVPCGNTVALVGVDQYILKAATITDIEDAHNIKAMKYSVSPVVKVAVKAKDGKDLPKLVEGLKKLSKSDPLVVCTTEESGEHIIAGCGELHVEICLKDLREEYAQCDFIMADPVVSYRETVSCKSSQTCLAKSPNKHNRIYLEAEPMNEDVCKNMENGNAGPKADAKDRKKVLKEFDWDDNDSLKIWCWGPETDGANVVVDKTQAVQYLLEIKEHVNSAWQWISKEGPLCEENMRGVRMNLMDVTMHADSIHRGAGQIAPPMRRCSFAALMTGSPSVQEPMFLVEITCPKEAMSGVYNVINLRRGELFEEVAKEGLPIVTARAYLPVAESFGFDAALRQKTGGQAFPTCVFDHWKVMEGDAMKEGKVQDLILACRKRKNLKVEMPKLADYNDKL